MPSSPKPVMTRRRFLRSPRGLERFLQGQLWSGDFMRGPRRLRRCPPGLSWPDDVFRSLREDIVSFPRSIRIRRSVAQSTRTMRSSSRSIMTKRCSARSRWTMTSFPRSFMPRWCFAQSRWTMTSFSRSVMTGDDVLLSLRGWRRRLRGLS